MASLSDIAAIYTFKLFGFTELGESKAAIIIAAVLWIAIMTWICYRGIELSARIQQVLLGAEMFILGLFAVVAFVKVYGSHPPAGSIKPSLSWINPFAMNFSDLVVALLLAVFIYWGWDSGVAVNEESEDPAEGPGKAAVVSTILLVLIYVVVSAAAQSFHGTAFLTNEANQEDVLNALGTGVLGGTLEQAADHRGAHLCLGLDADDDPADRAHDAVDGALESRHEPPLPRSQTLPDPHRLDARLRRARRSPSPSPCCCSPRACSKTRSLAIGFPICFYYGFTGVACGFYYRHDLRESAAQLPAAGPRTDDRRADAVRDRGQGGDLLRPRGKRLVKADPRHHPADLVRHRRHDPRGDHHAHLASVLP